MTQDSHYLGIAQRGPTPSIFSDYVQPRSADRRWRRRGRRGDRRTGVAGLVCENLLAARNILGRNKFSATVGSSSPQSLDWFLSGTARRERERGTKLNMRYKGQYNQYSMFFFKNECEAWFWRKKVRVKIYCAAVSDLEAFKKPLSKTDKVFCILPPSPEKRAE